MTHRSMRTTTLEGLLDCEATRKAGPDELQQLVALRPGADTAPMVPRSPAQALMLAVLEDGLRAYLGSRAPARAEAEHWVSSRRQWLFAFGVICETFGLEPNALRRALRELRARQATPKVIGRSRPNVRCAPLRVKEQH